MSWTDERVEILSKLWIEGRSASQIATELGLGVTRNAVIGKVHRLGLAGRPKAAVPMAVAPGRVKPKLVGRPAPEEVRPNTPAFEPAVTPLPTAGKPVVMASQASATEVVIPPSERVTIMELRDSSCRWPMGDPTSAEFRFCGARSTAGSGPYCAAHSRMAFQPAPERRRDKSERYARIA